MHRHRRLLIVVSVLVLLWAVFRVSGLSQRVSPQMLHDAFEQHRVGGLLLFTALFAIGNLIQLPGWIFLSAAVVALGQLWGGLATYLAASVSCIATFWGIRWLGADALREFKGRRVARIFARLDAHPVQSVLLLRLMFQTLPALNYALALSGVRFRSYLLGTLLGLPLPIALYCMFFHALARWLHWPVPGAA
jgi:uncharacterized membrane protein YdjX (TVP38/TMEM64 family)